jgi:hypothetical protein
MVAVMGYVFASVWKLYTEAKMSPRSGLVGFVVGKEALRQAFSERFGFPCQSFH